MQFFKVKQGGHGIFVNRFWQKHLFTKYVYKGAYTNELLNKFIMLVGFYFLLIGNITYAADLGAIAATFTIKEQDFSTMIQNKLSVISDKEMKKHQHKIIKAMKEKVNRPIGVSLPLADSYRHFVFNPSITTTQDITHNGKVLLAKGTTVNPHDFAVLSQPVLFIDGDDAASVTWASTQQGILVLTHGAPLELAQVLERQVYFDQMGKLIQRFGIQALPARVSQIGKNLVVEELVL